jgi:hypothetical protein
MPLPMLQHTATLVLEEEGDVLDPMEQFLP